MRAAASAVGVAVATALASCSIGPVDRLSTIQRIPDDSAAYSNSYAAAVSNQLLLNVLRARDRLPQQYMTIGPITDASGTSRSVSLSLDPLGRGNARGALAATTLGPSFGEDTKPSYVLTPFTDVLLAGAVSPISYELFDSLWRSGADRRLLLELVLDRVEVGSCSQHAPSDQEQLPSLTFSGGDGRRLRTDTKGRCFFRLGRIISDGLGTLDSPISGNPDYLLVGERQGECVPLAVTPTERHSHGGADAQRRASTNAFDEALRIIERRASDPTLQLERADNGALSLSRCPSETSSAILTFRGEHVQNVYRLHLRSFDQVIAALGCQIRSGAQSVQVCGSSQLFRVVDGTTIEDPHRANYAASVLYRGRRLYAGEAACLSSTAQCTPNLTLDRSGEVLAILSRIYGRFATTESLRTSTTVVLR